MAACPSIAVSGSRRMGDLFGGDLFGELDGLPEADADVPTKSPAKRKADEASSNPSFSSPSTPLSVAGSAAPSEAAESQGAASKKRKTGMHSGVGLCIMGDNQPRYCRMRVCQWHKSLYDIAMYQAANPQAGETKCDQELKKTMEDDNNCREIIALYEKGVPADVSLGKKKLKGQIPRFCHNALFRKRMGVVVAKTERAREVPMEKGFFIKQKTDAGWSPAEAEQEWKTETRTAEHTNTNNQKTKTSTPSQTSSHHVLPNLPMHLSSAMDVWKNKKLKNRTAEIADYKGRKGSPRYWLEKDPERIKDKTTYIDTATEETSEQFKNPKAATLAALRQFAHSSAGDFGDQFFGGKGVAPQQESGVIAQMLGKGKADTDNVDDGDQAGIGGGKVAGIEFPVE